MPEFVLMRCLISGKCYPDYNTGTPLRYCGEDDIIHVHPEDAAALIAAGLCDVYDARFSREGA